MLHIIQTSPFQSQTLEACLQNSSVSDVILFIENGVLALLHHSQFSHQLAKQQESITLYALKSDVDARGIAEQIIANVELIDYKTFVELTIAHYPISTWS